MNKRTLHLDLLHSGKYRRQIVKAKKGKGAYTRHDKHKKTRSDRNGFSFWPGIIQYDKKSPYKALRIVIFYHSKALIAVKIHYTKRFI